MDVQLDEKSTKFLTDEAKRFPNEVRRAFYYSCGITLRIMRGRMSGKSKHIAKWDEFTKRYRAMAKWDSAQTFGGKLMWPNGKKLTMEPEGDRVRIGWIGSMEDAARIFQEGGNRHNSWEWRRNRVEQGFMMHEVPEWSNTPQRPVVAQAQAEASKHLADWTLGAFVKVLNGKIKRWEVRYRENSGTKAGARAAAYGAKASDAVARVAAFYGENGYLSDTWAG
jgi:hypothetical protein